MRCHFFLHVISNWLNLPKTIAFFSAHGIPFPSAALSASPIPFTFPHSLYFCFVFRETSSLFSLETSFFTIRRFSLSHPMILHFFHLSIHICRSSTRYHPTCYQKKGEEWSFRLHSSLDLPSPHDHSYSMQYLCVLVVIRMQQSGACVSLVEAGWKNPHNQIDINRRNNWIKCKFSFTLFKQWIGRVCHNNVLWFDTISQVFRVFFPFVESLKSILFSVCWIAEYGWAVQEFHTKKVSIKLK